uniref:COMM domain-containing protein n=1 Tax=Timema douglasi TaxID=61478 RepID=A0A7R8VT75_TIMDO|nr:unnamed protein product [Timema douglasi]
MKVLQDFCKLSLDFLRKGPNPKLYQTAAQKLNVSPEVIRNAVDGLVHLLVESCRNKLDEQDFQDSVLALGFSEQQQQTLSTFYHSKKEEIQSALLRPTLDIPHYKDLDWRVDIQLGSRALHHQVTPLVSMKLSLDNGQCVPLQTDPNNLLHMTQVLEQALQEAKGQHTRRIQRTFKWSATLPTASGTSRFASPPAAHTKTPLLVPCRPHTVPTWCLGI